MHKKSIELDLSKLVGFKQLKGPACQTQTAATLKRPQAMVGGGGKLPGSPDRSV